MNLFKSFINLLQKEMTTPKAYGIFHFSCIGIMTLLILILYLKRKKANERQLKIVLLSYGFIALILELLKQLSWSVAIDPALNTITWDYQWYAFPFQLCTTPIIACIIAAFLKPSKVRTSLLSYISFVTILGSISTILLPDSCFTSDILVNIHTMFLHLGSFIVSIYLLFTKNVKVNFHNLLTAILSFLMFCLIAYIMNISIYHSGILDGETFNMFYISPYFESSLPVFVDIQKVVPHSLFLFIYICAISLGATTIFFISKLFQKKSN